MIGREADESTTAACSAAARSGLRGPARRLRARGELRLERRHPGRAEDDRARAHQAGRGQRGDRGRHGHREADPAALGAEVRADRPHAAHRPGRRLQAHPELHPPGGHAGRASGDPPGRARGGDPGGRVHRRRRQDHLQPAGGRDRGLSRGRPAQAAGPHGGDRVRRPRDRRRPAAGQGRQRRPGRPARPDAGGAGDVRARQAPGAAGLPRRVVRRRRAAGAAAAGRRRHRAQPGRDDLPGRGPGAAQGRDDRVSARLLIAVADDETARRAAAQAREAELEVVDIIADPDELRRALGRLDVDVLLLHDDLGAVPVLDLARELSAAFPEVGLILLAADDSPRLLRSAMQAGLRDVVALPLSLESFEASVRAASQWSRTMRDRVTGEESASGALGGQLVAVAGSKGGVGTTTVALHLGLAAARMAPGRPVCLVDFDLQKGDFRALVDTPYRRSIVDLVDVANEISVRHLQETLYTHKEGFRLLLAPEEGERAEDVDSAVARNVLSAVKARHALTVVDIGAVATEATAIAAEMASQVLIVTTPDVLALRGVRRMRELWKRLGVREDEDVRVLLNRASRRRGVQPDLARKVVGDTMAETTIPADFNALEAAVNTGSPARLEDGKLRGAFESLAAELDIVPTVEEGASPTEPRGLLARLGGERGQTSAEFMGLLPGLLIIVFGLWQIAVTGYTYVVAGHAAREGARQLAVLSSDSGKDPPYRKAAREDLPKGWRHGAEITKPTDVTVKVSLKVPVLIPAFRAPIHITTTADTSVEDEPLPDRQRATPTP